MRLFACAIFLTFSLATAVYATEAHLTIGHVSFLPWLLGLFTTLGCIAVMFTIDGDDYD